jgi:hypothetical protein
MRHQPTNRRPRHLSLPPLRTRAAHLIPIAPDLSPSTLFGSKEGGKALLEFLEVTKACFKPLEGASGSGFDPVLNGSAMFFLKSGLSEVGSRG